MNFYLVLADIIERFAYDYLEFVPFIHVLLANLITVFNRSLKESGQIV